MSRIAFVDLLFSWPPNGGADTDLYNVAEGLQRAGHEVKVFVVHEIGSTDRGIVDPATLPFPCAPMVFERGALLPGALCAALREAVDAFRPDLVFAQHGFALKPYSIEALAHYPVVARYYAHELECLRDPLRFRDGAPCPNDYLHTPDVCRRCTLEHRKREIQHGLPTTWTGEWLAAEAYRPEYHARVLRSLRALRGVIVYNTRLAGELTGFHDRVCIIPSGVHARARPAAPPPVRAAGDRKTILMVGRADDPLKGLDTLLEAGRSLAQRRSDFQVVATHFDCMLSHDWFRATGWLNHDEALALYMEADICATPSIWEEPFGLAAVEAMSAARPVVASAVGGLSDIVRDGETGFLTPPADAGALADRLAALLDDAALRARMGAAGRARVESEYDWDAIIAKHYLPRIEAWTK